MLNSNLLAALSIILYLLIQSNMHRTLKTKQKIIYFHHSFNIIFCVQAAAVPLDRGAAVPRDRAAAVPRDREATAIVQKIRGALTTRTIHIADRDHRRRECDCVGRQFKLVNSCNLVYQNYQYAYF